MSSIPRTDPSRAASSASELVRSASIRLPSETVSWMTASAAGTPRSSSIAATNASGRPSPTGDRVAGTHPLDRALDEALEAPVAGRGVGQRTLGELDVRAVVRRPQVEPQLHGPHALDHLGDQQRVAQGLAHLLPGRGHPGVVHPVLGEAVADGPGLGDLVLVVREHEVQATAVDVERAAQVHPGHRRALQVPAGTADPPRGLPPGTAVAGALPQREVPHVALAGVRVRVLGRLHVGDPLPGQRPVLRERGHVEVHVTVGGVGMPGVDQPLHQGDHRRHVTGGPGLEGGRQAAEDGVRLGERPLVVRRDGPPRPRLLAWPSPGSCRRCRSRCAGRSRRTRRRVNQRRRMSKLTPERMWPMCGADCTVAPQTYTDTRPASRGTNVARAARGGVVQSQAHPEDSTGRPAPDRAADVRWDCATTLPADPRARSRRPARFKGRGSRTSRVVLSKGAGRDAPVQRERARGWPRQPPNGRYPDQNDANGREDAAVPGR